ncbi:MAG: mannose-6-phosphate isomerase, class I [Polyangiaceae bacterium]
MFRLDNPIKEYAWGSRDILAKLAHRPSSGKPEAELWMGAHPSASSTLAGRGVSLASWVEEDPVRALGSDIAKRFGELPYLFKVLAADKPLSLQAHPSKRQAEAGFLRENTRGVPVDDPKRIYKDKNHKPELVVAMGDEPFEALYGFREPFESARMLQAMVHANKLLGQRHQAALGEAIASLHRGSPADAMRCLLEMPAQLKKTFARDAAEACANLEGPSFEWACKLEAEYPEDVGAVISLLLNYVKLSPGEGLYLPAGNLHAYLKGAAIELMANSDNVLRGGLTPKHVDVKELLAIVENRAITAAPLHPTEVRPGAFRYDLGARGPEEFELWRFDLTVGAEHTVPGGPSIVLASRSSCEVHGSAGSMTLEQGASCFISAEESGQPIHVRHVRSAVGEDESVVHCATVPMKRGPTG